MNVTLRQLRAFLAVARTGSFTQAAQRLYITQSALSGLVKDLEQNLGVRLLERSTRRVCLTEPGERLYPLVQGVEQDLDSALRSVVSHRGMRSGEIRVACAQLLASTLMPELIAAHRVQYPQIEVRLIDTAVDAVPAAVLAGEADLGIGPQRALPADLVSTRLFDGLFMAVCAPGHDLSRLGPVHWADVVAHPVITLRGHFTDRLLQDLHAVSPDLSFTPAYEVAYMSTALSMVRAGLGVGLCIPYAASLVEVFGLCMRAVEGPEVYRRFEVFSRRDRTLTPAADCFLSFIQPRIRALPFLC